MTQGDYASFWPGISVHKSIHDKVFKNVKFMKFAKFNSKIRVSLFPTLLRTKEMSQRRKMVYSKNVIEDFLSNFFC